MKLPNLKGQRTKVRNAVLAEIEKVEKFTTQGATVDSGMDLLVTSNLLQRLAQRLESLNTSIFEHKDITEQDLDNEVEFSTEFELRLHGALAKLEALAKRNSLSTLSHDLSLSLQQAPGQSMQQIPTSTPNPVKIIQLKSTLGGDGEQGEQGNVANGASKAAQKSSSSAASFQPTESSSVSSRYYRELNFAPDKFDGNRARYNRFVSLFRSWVDKFADLTAQERLILLAKHLEGEPKELVEALEPTDANYEVALSLLHENYSRPDTEKQRILTELRTLPRVQRSDDVADLRKLLTVVQRHIASLTAMDVPYAAFALLVKTSLEAALPLKTRQLFRRDRAHRDELEALATRFQPGTSSSHAVADQSAADEKETKQLVDFLRRHVMECEDSIFADQASGPASKKDADPASKKAQKDAKKNINSTVAAQVGNSANSGRAGKLPCLFCEVSEHRSSRCRSDMSLQGRREILKKLKRCEKCFRPEHKSASECHGPKFPCDICKSQKHFTAMHSTQKAPTQETSVPPPQPSSSSTSAAVSSAAKTSELTSDGVATMVLTASAFIVNGGRKIPIRIFLDSGSTDTFISPKVRKLLKNERPIYRATMAVQAFGSQHQLEVDKFKIRLKNFNGDKVFECSAYEHDFGVDPPNDHPPAVTRAIQRFDKLHSIADRSLLGEWAQTEPAILLGQDCLNSIMTLRAPEVIIGDVRAFETIFGWAVGGSIKTGAVQATVTAVRVACCMATLSPPARALQALWKVETLGIHDSAKESSPLSVEEEDALKQFKEGVRYDGQRYEVCFPKRASIATLSNNLTLATERLARKIKQLERQPEKYQRYHQEVMKFVGDGYACEISDFPGGSPSQEDASYYMPHHAVVTGDEPKVKWRIVFDCSAKEKGKSSLNENLIPGPNLNPDLVALLLNFRLYPVAVSTDIKSAYMRIGVNDDDQRYFRLLWKAPGESRMRRFQMQRVTWGAAPSGFLLAATLRKHFERSRETAMLKFGDYLYADDFLRSFQDDEKAVHYIDKLRKTLQDADMHLAKWKTNSQGVSDHLLGSGVERTSVDLNLSGVFRVLGVTWNPRQDALMFSLSGLCARSVAEEFGTKRAVLSLVASVYDPLGLLIPFTLRGKLLIQKIWTENLSWDEPVSVEVRGEVSQWSNELKDLEGFCVRRQYSSTDEQPTAFHLHVFGDASPVAYACAAFVEYQFGSGKSEVSLVMCKSRIAPRDALTLPRLELLAALIATRLKDFICERLDVKFDSVSLYTDSMITCYHWVTATSPSKWRPYVANRVAEIQRRSSAENWFFVPGEENVSDLATRGVSAKVLLSSRHWWDGPSWLKLSRAEQPVSQPRLQGVDLSPVTVEARIIAAPIVAAKPLIELERFNSAARAARVLALVLRFKYKTLRQTIPSGKALSEKAETALIRWSQSKHFAAELRAVGAAKRVPTSSKLAAFRLFIDENGVLRARTRLTLGPHFTQGEKEPMIVAGESRLATLYIYDAHRSNAHFGVSTVMNMLRRRLWITRGRQVIKALLRQCAICRKRRAAAASQIEAPLPAHRVTLTVPFETSGLDFCGPFYAKVRSEKKSRSKDHKTKEEHEVLKMYVALFTCTSVRAVHLEVVPSQSTPQVHLALRRFLSLYPACSKLVTDNARSFVKASTEIKKLFNSQREPEVRDLLAQRRLDWEFVCPRCPSRGGFYERLVGSFKSALIKTLGRSFIGYEEFRTIVSELAAVVNDRPLTSASTDVDEPCALTPAQFLRGGPQPAPLAATGALDRLGPDGAPPGDELREVFKHRTAYFRHLAARWKREYLLQLRTANQTQGHPTRPIAVGDVCILRDDSKPRAKWELVRVKEAHLGRDGEIRTYTIRFANRKESRRAAQLLCPLEAELSD